MSVPQVVWPPVKESGTCTEGECALCGIVLRSSVNKKFPWGFSCHDQVKSNTPSILNGNMKFGFVLVDKWKMLFTELTPSMMLMYKQGSKQTYQWISICVENKGKKRLLEEKDKNQHGKTFYFQASKMLFQATESWRNWELLNARFYTPSKWSLYLLIILSPYLHSELSGSES